MKHKNKIKSLHQTDETTAQNIMEQYPPQWDMDKVFKKTYQKYLSQKNESLQEDGIFNSNCAEASACPKQALPARRLWRTGGYVIFAAAYIGMFLFILKMSDMAPPTEHFPDGINDSEVPHLDVDSNEGTTTAADSTEMEPQPALTTETAGTETASESADDTTEQTSTAETSTADLTQPAETELPPTEVTAAVTVSPPAVTVPVTEETAAPSSGEESSAESTTASETVTTPETTTTTTETPPVIESLGHFEVEEPADSNSFFTVRYVRESNAPPEEHEHSFAAEGFTLTNVRVDNPDYDYRSVIYNLEDTAGQSYMVREYRYAYFMPSFNPEYYPLTKSYTIGGKTVFLIYQEDPESVCHLMWDDGCHVCHITSQYKDLANMELLVQSHIIQ